jgi:hypothetical protein
LESAVDAIVSSHENRELRNDRRRRSTILEAAASALAHVPAAPAVAHNIGGAA